MEQILDKNQIELLDKFINENEPTYEHCISIKDIKKRKICYDLINIATIGSYYIYGGSGFRTYSFFKGKDNKIYNFEIYLQEPTAYSIQNY